jgi:hypothetical protein
VVTSAQVLGEVLVVLAVATSLGVMLSGIFLVFVTVLSWIWKRSDIGKSMDRPNWEQDLIDRRK